MKREIQAIFTKMNLIRHACSMIWRFKDLKRRTAFGQALRNKAFNIGKNPKCDGYQRGVAPMVYKFFDKKSKSSGVDIPLEFNEQLAEELHKPIIRKCKKRTVYSDLKIKFGELTQIICN